MKQRILSRERIEAAMSTNADLAKLNPGVLCRPQPAMPEPEKPEHAKPRKMREMNGTERGFMAIQEARVRRGDLQAVVFEPLSFAIGGGVRYKVDFMLRYPENRLEFIEIKGGKIWKSDLVRFKIAADIWSWLGEFQMIQKIRGQYERIR